MNPYYDVLFSIYNIFHFLFHRNVAVFGSLGATFLSLGLFLYLSHLQTSEASQLGRSAPGQIIANSRLIRLAIFLISNTLIATCAVFSVVRNAYNPFSEFNFETLYLLSRAFA